MVREAAKRKKKFEAGVDGDAIGKKITRLKPGMVEGQATHMGAVVLIEGKVKQLVEAAGVSSMQVAQYLNVARKMMKICGKFSGTTRDNECARIHDLWVGRGLDTGLITSIAAMCGCAVTPGVAAGPSAPWDFWSDPASSVVLTAGGEAAPVALPDVVVAGLPVGATILRVVAILIISVLRDTSTADNAVDVATGTVEVRRGPGGTWTTAINIPINSWAVIVGTSPDRGGAPLIGNIDVSGEVTGNGTYNLQFALLGVTGSNLLLLDVMVGLRIYFR